MLLRVRPQNTNGCKIAATTSSCLYSEDVPVQTNAQTGKVCIFWPDPQAPARIQALTWRVSVWSVSVSPLLSGVAQSQEVSSENIPPIISWELVYSVVLGS